MEEYNSYLFKLYIYSFLKVVLFVFCCDKINVFEVKDKEFGIIYYELKFEVVEEILNVF